MQTLRALVVIATLFPVVALADDGFRCGNRIVSVGEPAAQVRNKCGAPASVDRHEEAYREGGSGAKISVELWTYDFGPSSFIRVLRFENGVLRRVDTGDYGR